MPDEETVELQGIPDPEHASNNKASETNQGS